MKKICFLFLAVLCVNVMCGQDKKKVAVYVTATSSVPDETKKIVGSELVAAIAANQSYSAIERTSAFLDELGKEQGYQLSGNVDDSQISRLGKQFGVDIVCVADITPYQNAYYIQARFIDVENAIIMSTERITSNLKGLDEMVKAAESLANKLIGNENSQSKKVSTRKPEPIENITIPGKISYEEFKILSNAERKELLIGNTFALSSYKSYRLKNALGWTLVGIGSVPAGLGIIFIESDDQYKTLVIACTIVGGAALITGSVLLLSNIGGLKKTYNIYTRSGRTIAFTPTPVVSSQYAGLGFVVNF